MAELQASLQDAAEMPVQAAGDRALLVTMQRVFEARLAGDSFGEQVWEGVLNVLVDHQMQAQSAAARRH